MGTHRHVVEIGKPCIRRHARITTEIKNFMFSLFFDKPFNVVLDWDKKIRKLECEPRSGTQKAYRVLEYVCMYGR